MNLEEPKFKVTIKVEGELKAEQRFRTEKDAQYFQAGAYFSATALGYYPEVEVRVEEITL